MTTLHLELFDNLRLKIWENLGVFSRYGGVLGGGTAIALQIGHRKSYDFDIFFTRGISSTVRKLAYSCLSDSTILTQLDNPDQLNLISESGIKLTLLHYPYSRQHRLIKTKELPLFDLRDLASSKAYAIGRRGTWRDYVDTFFLLKNNHITLKEIINEANSRYGNEFGGRLFLEQLCYFDDLGDFEVEFLKEEVNPEEIKKYLEKEVKRYWESID